VVIEQVTPILDGGRYPIKRSIGQTVQVSADIFKDGHDLIGARLIYRHAGDSAFRAVPMVYDFGPDRWTAAFTVDRLGRWEYAVEAWPDPIRTWRTELVKRVDAGQDVASELLEGAGLIARASERGDEIDARLKAVADRLKNTALGVTERLDTAYDESWLELTQGPLVPEALVRSEPALQVIVDRDAASFAAWYELFPRSEGSEPGRHGTFADVERRLPELASLGFDVLYFPPIHPIGRTHRKGRNNAEKSVPGDVGSPWAIGAEQGGHTAILPELGTFADFENLVHAAREFGMEIALDYALQCSPDHPWVKSHPEWFFIRPDGSIRYAENPPKKYEDIYPLNFWCEEREALWNACRDVVLFWVERGVRTFRVDNPHTKPLSFWEWMIREVQRRHPDVVFLSEAFTRPKRMKALNKLGFSQSYTYFTWKNTKQELSEYLTELTQGEMPEFFRPNFFANTPDILHEYLQHGGRPAFRIRFLLAATLSPLYGIYAGYELCENVPVHPGSEEYIDSEKYELKHRDYNAPGNLKKDIARLNRIRRENPALQTLANLTLLENESPNILSFAKTTGSNTLLVVVNLNPHAAEETHVFVPADVARSGSNFTVHDLVTGERYNWQVGRNYVRLDPHDQVGHVLRIEV
jgi:starch synthase (maltosyl-transferring)